MSDQHLIGDVITIEDRKDVMITKPYRILRIRGSEVLLCLCCDRWSAHPQDILHHYCGYCRVFLDDLPEDMRSTDVPAKVTELERVGTYPPNR